VAAETWPKSGTTKKACQLALSPEQAYLEKAYEHYLYLRRIEVSNHQITEGIRDSGKILFKRRSYQIVDFLGEGGRGAVFRARNSKGEVFIFKIMKRLSADGKIKISAEGEVRSYEEMKNRFSDAPEVEDYEEKTETIKIKDFRAIPIDMLYSMLNAADTPPGIMERFKEEVDKNLVIFIHERLNIVKDLDLISTSTLYNLAWEKDMDLSNIKNDRGAMIRILAERLSHPSTNQAFDIDRHIVIPIDRI
jgi:hypothetical protein